MRAKEFIIESVTFTPVVEKDYDGQKYGLAKLGNLNKRNLVGPVTVLEKKLMTMKSILVGVVTAKVKLKNGLAMRQS